MSRARPLALAAAVAAQAALVACGSDAAPAATVAFRQPAALAIFNGYTLDDPANLRPYLVVANASRNDLTVIDATDDRPVLAPIELRALVIPVAERPTQLVSASLGDGGADLLVAVPAGTSLLQLVRTWTAANEVIDGASVDVAAAIGRANGDVLALAALPPAPDTPGVARVAVALAGRVGGAPEDRPEIAIVEYTRVTADGSIQPGTVTRSGPLAFQPLELAVLPDDPDAAGLQTEIYAATADPMETAPGSGVLVSGVARLSADLGTVTPLDARGPTRLVAAARLRERAGSSTASDASAFSADAVPRVYAVLDESGCGPARRIDCGVVSLDPTKTAGDDALSEDWAGLMPYRAPMRVPGRPLALAVAQPPAVAPPENAVYAGEFMRLLAGPNERTTTGVAAVASDDGFVYFLDLGRFETVTGSSPVATRTASVAEPDPVGEGEAAARLWLLAGTDATSFPATAADAGATVGITPGYTPTDVFTVSYQGVLPDLDGHRAQAGVLAGGQRWLALQGGGASGPVTDVAKLFHPALGVKDGPSGDLVALGAPGLPEGCEARVESFLAPRAEFPGGALVLAEEGAGTCVAALYAGLAEGAVRRDVTAAIRARGLVLSGLALDYAGRPQRGVEYALAYPATEDEDALAAACPIADWDGSFPVDVDVTCGGTCDRSEAGPCERLVLARKARRIHHLSYPCEDDACRARFPDVAFPEANGPALTFTVDVQRCPDTPCDPARPPLDGQPDPVRGMSLTLTPSSGIFPHGAQRAAGSPFHASGAVAFDRSRLDAAAGYRFLVAYPADLVYDVSPSVNPPSAFAIR